MDDTPSNDIPNGDTYKYVVQRLMNVVIEQANTMSTLCEQVRSLSSQVDGTTVRVAEHFTEHNNLLSQYISSLHDKLDNMRTSCATCPLKDQQFVSGLLNASKKINDGDIEIEGAASIRDAAAKINNVNFGDDKFMTKHGKAFFIIIGMALLLALASLGVDVVDLVTKAGDVAGGK